MRDALEFRSLVDRYFAAVRGGERVVGKLERQFVERHFADLARAGAGAEIRFNEARAVRVLQFAERYIVHTKGEWRRKPFQFCERSAWMAGLIWVLFGWEKRDDLGQWVRRYRRAYVSVARKNGKTMLAAILALYMVAFDQEGGAEVYFAATTRDQAKLGWRQAEQCVKHAKDAGFRKLFVPSADYRAVISVKDEDAVIRALASDGDRLDGLNPYLAIVDELHAHPDGSVVDVLKSGMGARREPMLFLITTAGGNRTGVCWQYDHLSEQVLGGIVEDDALFTYIARPDEGDAWTDEVTWEKANPNLGVSVKRQFLRDECRDAINTPDRQAEFRRKQCNEWAESSLAWLPLAVWDRCAAAPSIESGSECTIGIDLSSSRDLTAKVNVHRVGEFYDVTAQFWIPRDTLEERCRGEASFLKLWAEQGLISVTSGPVVDQDAIKMAVLNDLDRYVVREVAFDPWNAAKLATELDQLGAPMTQFAQRYSTFSPAMREAERLLLEGRVRHGGNPVLRWMFANLAIKSDAAGNRMPDKKRAADRIDGVTAFLMALGRAVATAEKTPEIWVLGADGVHHATA